MIDVRFICPKCGSDENALRRLDQHATETICANCGYIHNVCRFYFTPWSGSDDFVQTVTPDDGVMTIGRSGGDA